MSVPEAEDPIDEAFAAYLRSCDEGAVESREDFLAQFPEIADELRSLMDAADALNRFSGIESAPDSASKIHPSDETVHGKAVDPNDSVADPEATLPEANRAPDDPGPRLPFDLGDYLLEEEIGRGGMGVVYRAKQRLLDRCVAVKMIRGGMLACENDVRRFYIEAQAAAGLRHPGIVSVYQFGHRAGHHYFSMALIEGTDLQRKINEDEMPIDSAARYVRDVALAIHHAHQKNVLHRDLKPANVLVDLDDRIHITDFGLAKNMGVDSSVTGSGAAVGTPNYMAPEQAGGHSDRATRQSDIYSLGAILFACVTGRPPLVGDSIVDTLLQVVHEPAPMMKAFRSGVSSDLETIVAKCLEKQPGKRYRSARALAEDLDAFLEGRPISARPRGPITKSWHWFSGVPLVGALIGRKVVRATASHRRFQAAMLMLFAMMPFFIVGAAVFWNHHVQKMPKHVEIAGGIPNGAYNEVSNAIVNRLRDRYGVDAEVIPSNGSIDNRRRLSMGEVQIAPMQASVIQGGDLCVVAPLFYEAAHLLVRTENEQWNIDDLRHQPIAVGRQGSGSRKTADMILDTLNIPLEVTPREPIPWRQLLDNPAESPSVALICIGRGNSIVIDLLRAGWRLMPIPNSHTISEQHPALRVIEITREDYDWEGIPGSGLSTVATTAFLATKRGAPSALVRSTLEVLYAPPQIFDGLIPRERAAEWQELDFHSTARSYFSTVEEQSD